MCVSGSTRAALVIGADVRCCCVRRPLLEDHLPIRTHGLSLGSSYSYYSSEEGSEADASSHRYEETPAFSCFIRPSSQGLALTHSTAAAKVDRSHRIDGTALAFHALVASRHVNKFPKPCQMVRVRAWTSSAGASRLPGCSHLLQSACHLLQSLSLETFGIKLGDLFWTTYRISLGRLFV